MMNLQRETAKLKAQRCCWALPPVEIERERARAVESERREERVFVFFVLFFFCAYISAVLISHSHSKDAYTPHNHGRHGTLTIEREGGREREG